MPRIAHKPTARDRQQVESMSAYGLKQEVIANVIGVSDRTLRKYYRKELDYGDGMAQAKIGEALYEKAKRANEFRIVGLDSPPRWRRR